MGDGEKICVLCGQSCAGQARIKNAKGQYAHQACLQAKQEAKAAAEAVVENDGLYDDYDDGLGGMDDLLGDIEIPEQVGSADGCPGCGQRMSEGAVVCMSCGYNAQSGKAMMTKSKKDPGTGVGSGIGNATLGGAAAISGFAAGPTLAIVGAIIGGLIGAVIWAAIAYFTGFEIGWIAIGVGVLVGIGAQLGGGTQTTGGGMVVGVMAAIVAVGAIAGGKYGASYMFVRDAFGGASMLDQMTIEDIDDNRAKAILVDTICQEHINADKFIEWDKELFVEAAYWPEDYPIEIQDMVNEKWESYDDSERMALRKGIAIDADTGYTYRDVTEEWALSTMAYMATSSMIEDGDTIDWPDPNLAIDSAEWPDDYPEAIQTQTTERWDAMSDDEQMEYKGDVVRSINEARTMISSIVTQGSFIESFKSPFDILFLLLAVGAAYKIGYGD